MDVWVEKHKCTGCAHCHDVCPVAVFEMKDRDSPDANNDHAPDADKWKGTTDADVLAKWKDVKDGHNHFADKFDGTTGGLSVGVNGSACILCQACLIECEGECIVITDDAGTVYRSIYK
ncbi:MAG: hypothetical protein M1528_00695 [Candidatus Marsarchaeota archaeon]|jgi:NAD-dependent dihydropyrimidine dehydrogenase PreA subunit|nr:hypothetical protein [Candidatus Marsarchaeota archaeon]MCL5115041.1 hypothetical protein [Candidatus Marsarchaeota archaeon]